MRISDWSSDVCSSDLQAEAEARLSTARAQLAQGGTGEELGEALDSPVISQLRAQRARVSAEAAALSQRYGPGHPDFQRAPEQLRDLDKEINGEGRLIVANVRIKAIAARELTPSLARDRRRSGVGKKWSIR